MQYGTLLTYWKEKKQRVSYVNAKRKRLQVEPLVIATLTSVSQRMSCITSKGGKSTHILVQVFMFKKILKVEILIELFYLSKTEKVQALK